MAVPITIDKCRRLCEKGFYTRAIEQANQARAQHGDSAGLIIQLAEIHILHGYFNRAYTVLRSAPSETSTTHPASKWAMDILLCFIDAHRSTKLVQIVEQAEEIYGRAKKYLQTNPIVKHTFVIQLYHYKLLNLTSILHLSQYKNRHADMATEMNRLFDLLVQSKTFNNALRVAISLWDERAKLRCLEHLLTQKDLPKLVAAKAQAGLATILRQPEQNARRRELRASAHRVLEQVHFHGALDIELERCYESLVTGNLNAGDGGHNQDIDTLTNQYRQLDYPNGLSTALEQCMDIAMRARKFDERGRLEKELLGLTRKTDNHLRWLFSNVSLLAQYNLQGGHDDLVMNTTLDIYDHLQHCDLPLLQGLAARTLSSIFERRQNAPEALHWASICKKKSESCLPETSSDDRLQYLTAEALNFKTNRRKSYQAMQSICDDYVERDLRDNLPDNAIAKLDVMISVFNNIPEMPAQEQCDCMMKVLKRMKDILASTDSPDQTTRMAKHFQQHGNCLITVARRRRDCVKEREAIDMLEKALQLYHQGFNEALTVQAISTKNLLSLAWHSFYRKLEQMNHGGSREAHEALKTAEKLSLDCTGDYEKMGLNALIPAAKQWTALIRYDARLRGWAESKEVFASLLAAERSFDDRRNEIAISSGLNAIQEKQLLAKSQEVRNVYRYAFELCLFDGDNQNAWQWVQKAKARSLSDTLGLGCLIPETLLQEIKSDAGAMKMYEKEARLTQLIERASHLDRFDLQTELRKLQKEMTTHRVLRDMRGLRQGTSITAQQLLDPSSSFSSVRNNHQLVFVDWYVKGDEVFILVLHSNHQPTAVIKLNVTLECIHSWLKNYLHSNDNRTAFLNRGENHPHQALRFMDCLIEPLGRFTKAGETLVLSPAAPLDAIPLHALRLPTGCGPLIERNPVVYCSSLTVFYQCCERAASKQKTSNLKSVFMAVYEDAGNEKCDIREQESLYKFSADLAIQMKGKHITGPAVSREKLVQEWPTADHIYFHGHCLTTLTNITNQALILTRKEAEDDDNRHTDGVLTNPASVTVRDIFDLKLRAPHISLMACGSASQKIEPGDEPLGLVTAFLCAGAASVTGTLWPIASATARTFAAYFYNEIQKMQREKTPATASMNPRSKSEESRAAMMVNLAVAMQQAVIRMKREHGTRMPYHWAAFVLNGACFAMDV